MTEQGGVQATALLRLSQYVLYPYGFVILRAESVEPCGCQRDCFLSCGGLVELRSLQFMVEIVLRGEDTVALNIGGRGEANGVRVFTQLPQQLRCTVHQLLIRGSHRRCHAVGTAPGIHALPPDSLAAYAAVGQNTNVLDLGAI